MTCLPYLPVYVNDDNDDDFLHRRSNRSVPEFTCITTQGRASSYRREVRAEAIHTAAAKPGRGPSGTLAKTFLADTRVLVQSRHDLGSVQTAEMPQGQHLIRLGAVHRALERCDHISWPVKAKSLSCTPRRPAEMPPMSTIERSSVPRLLHQRVLRQDGFSQNGYG